MVVQFNPKILRLNVGMFGSVLGQSETEFGLLLDCVCFFYVLLLKKRNNILDV